MKLWLTKAMDFLKASLEPPKHELNELEGGAGGRACLNQE